MSEAGRPAEAGAPASPPLWLCGLHLLALWSFALVQPLFDLLGRNADFFVARGSPSGDIVFFAFFVTLVPPLLLFGIEALAGLAAPAARRVLHLVFVGALVAIIALGLVKKAVDASSALLIPLCLALGAGAAVWYARETTVRSFVSVLAAAPPLFLALFLLSSPVHKLVITGEANADVRNLRSNVPVVMVSFDEFPLNSVLGPDDRIDAARFPNFARFARGSTWFRNTTTVADGTRWATPIVMSGTLPHKDALPTFSDYPQNLFTVLGGGYRLHVTEPVTTMCPKNLCADTGPRESEEGEAAGVASPEQADDSFAERMGSLASDLGIVSLHLVLPDDLRARLPSVSETLGDFGGGDEERSRPRPPTRAQRELRRATGRRLTELIPEAKKAELSAPAFPRFLRQIRSWDGRGQPPLYFLHVLLPHHPWHLLPSGRSYGESEPPLPGLRDNVWKDDGEAVLQGWQRHLLQVGYTDRALGQLMTRLRATGLYDRSLIVLAADHGAHFAPNAPRRKITPDGVAGIAAVPFFVKLPGQRRGRIVDEHVETIDILPTIADALDVRLPRQADGRSALSAGFKGRGQVSVWSTTSTREFKRVDIPMARYLERRRLLGVQQASLFGTGDSPRLWSVGPHPEVVGRAVASLPAGTPTGASVRLDRPDDYTAVDPRSGYAPSHITGEIDGLPGGRDVAVAVNGRIEAVARTYSFLGTRFSFMVPERAFREGPNQVAVYAVDTRGRSVRLTLLSA